MQILHVLKSTCFHADLMPLSFSFNHHGFWLISMRSFIYIVYISTLTNVYDITLQWVYVCNYLVEEQTQYTYIISKHKFINLKLTRPLYQSMCENLQRMVSSIIDDAIVSFPKNLKQPRFKKR